MPWCCVRRNPREKGATEGRGCWKREMGASQSAPTEISIHQFTVKVKISLGASLRGILCYLFGFWILIWWNLRFVVQDGSSRDVDLGIYKGKVLLVVNVASKWYSALGFSE
ncbi:hypothetical protein B296_00004277 [Ensete ventricosum]|uniref:Glutathione peroxidase n=1 Tax=Ensete ventricosum TaxID=4639 RepID=A0A426ZE15_ENSVE|nr:hypothetical protein B296_00004277 [Ensete ventricosum]